MRQKPARAPETEKHCSLVCSMSWSLIFWRSDGFTPRLRTERLRPPKTPENLRRRLGSLLSQTPSLTLRCIKEFITRDGGDVQRLPFRTAVRAARHRFRGSLERAPAWKTSHLHCSSSHRKASYSLRSVFYKLIHLEEHGDAKELEDIHKKPHPILPLRSERNVKPLDPSRFRSNRPCLAVEDDPIISFWKVASAFSCN